MLRKFLDYQLSLTGEGKPLRKFRALISAMDTFLYETPERTLRGPHIRDAVDLKRWMLLVIYALIPAFIMAIWNTGVQGFVYGSGDVSLSREYFSASQSFSGYFSFAFKDGHYLSILKIGLIAFLPILIISYLVGGFWEVIFAQLRGHDVSEGFLVTGALFALILPSTLPYWMVALGVSAGTILGKEVFGGTGMNILNPALFCRAFLFFTFPTKMTGDVWVGTNPTIVKASLLKMNQSAGLGSLDGITQASYLNQFNVSVEIKRIHIDAIATNFKHKVGTLDLLEKQFAKWKALLSSDGILGSLNADQLQSFLTTPIAKGGLGLSPENYLDALQFANLKYGLGIANNANLFFGNMIGSMGETSTLACLLGAIFLIIIGIGSWRTMLSMVLGVLLCGWLFKFGSEWIGPYGGAWNPAKFDFPSYKHLLLGGLAFGAAFMATDPVSSPGINLGKWIYGLLIGALVIIIRLVNPAFPEGVMLAILFGNVFAPLIDQFSLKRITRKRRARFAKKIA